MTILEKEGMLGLYRGMLPAIIGSAVSWGGYFYFYERAKTRRLYSTEDKISPVDSHAGATSAESAVLVRLRAIDHLFAGVEAGAIMVFLTNPLWLIKTRLQIQGQHCGKLKQYNGFNDSVATIIREEGILGLYKGLVPALLLTSHGAIQFMVYENMKVKMLESNLGGTNSCSML